MSDLDLDLLRCFAVVAELRNFTSAGKKLSRSQSAVSIKIKKLEDQLGTKLFIRNNSIVELTPSGKDFLPMALHLLHESEQVMAAMQGPKIAGKLRFGFLEYTAPHLLASIMKAMQRSLPEVELQFHIGLSSTLRKKLSDGEIDLALALNDGSIEQNSPIFSDQLLWVESSASSIESDSAHLDICLMQAPCKYRDVALKSLTKMGMAYSERLNASSVHAVQNAVKSGLGVTVLGASCITQGLKPSSNLNNSNPLPKVSLGLFGNDTRKEAVAKLLHSVLRREVNGYLVV